MDKKTCSLCGGRGEIEFDRKSYNCETSEHHFQTCYSCFGSGFDSSRRISRIVDASVAMKAAIEAMEIYAKRLD